MEKGSCSRNRRGQGLTEYIIIVALVAIAAIGVVNIFGNQIRNQFATIVAAMSGNSLTVESLADDAKGQATHSPSASKNRK